MGGRRESDAEASPGGDHGVADGWRNEHVRTGFDVNGAESRVIPIRMERRVMLSQLGYEVLGETARDLAVAERRPLYPTIRRIGAFLRREQAAEQVIAEQEYLINEMTAVDRHGVGSKRWLLGVGYVLGLFGLGFGLGVAGGAAIIFAFTAVLTSLFGVSPVIATLSIGLVIVILGLVALVWQLTHIKRSIEE